MRAATFYRVFLTLTMVIVGTGWLYIADGQVFDNSLGFIGCMIVAVAVCLWGGADRKLSPLTRCLWVLIAIGLLVEAGLMTLELPKYYRFQRDFNKKVSEAIDGD